MDAGLGARGGMREAAAGDELKTFSGNGKKAAPFLFEGLAMAFMRPAASGLRSSEKACGLGQERLMEARVGGVDCSISSCPLPAVHQAHPLLVPRKPPTTASCTGERCGMPRPPPS